MVEDRFNHWCSVWAKEFAILHPDDLPLEERLRLYEHASTCPDCSATLQQYLLCNALLRDHPFEEMFLIESAAMIQADGKVPAALEQLWEEQNSANTNSRELRENLIASKLNVENQRANSFTNAQAVKPLSHNQTTTSPTQLGKGMYTIDLRIRCSNTFSGVLVGDEEQTELTIESIVGTALLEVFDVVLFENVTIYRSPEEAAQGLEVNYPDLAEDRQIL